MLYNVRLTHKEVPIGKISEAGQALVEFAARESIHDYVYLQTCNRVELYYLNNPHQPPDGFVYESGVDAFRHLMRVACGLESFVVGETEILHQIKRALSRAIDEGHCSEGLAWYFTEAIRVGRKGRKSTKISAGKVSVVSLAVDHVRGLIGEMPGKKILVVGAGEIAAKAARTLKGMAVEKIFVSNRNYARALKLARAVGGAAYRLSHLEELVKKVDVIICATSAPHPIITKERVMLAKQGVVIVDLSVPPNVDRSIREMPGVRLITMEELSERARNNLMERIKEMRKVEGIIDAELKNSGARESLRELYLYAEAVRKGEIAKALRLLRTRAPERVIEDMSKSLVKKLYHPLRDRSREMGNTRLVKKQEDTHGG